MEFPTELPRFEKRTRELMNTVEFSPMNNFVARVFVANYQCTLSASRVKEIGYALTQFEATDEAVVDTLENFRKLRVLRSPRRRVGEAKRWEVNY